MAMAAGALFRIVGGITGGISANKNIKRFEDMMASLGRPDPLTEQRNWFADLDRFYPQANRLSERLRGDEMSQNLALREQALPGFGAATGDAMRSASAMLRGEFTPAELSTFARVGGASTVGLGFGGTGFGALNTGLYGLRGARGATEQGMGLLTRLLGTMPQVSAPTTMGLLGQLMTPQQRIQHQMNLRQQQIGMNTQLASMPTALDSWSSHLNESGAMLMGGGAMGMMGGAGGGAAGGAGAGGAGTGGGWGSPGMTPTIRTVYDQYGMPTKKWNW